MAPKPLEYNATLVKREDHTAELATFHVRYDEPLGQSFEPGQYVAIGLNNVDKPELGSVRRSMSIASAPEQKDVFEFYIRWVKVPESDNPLTHLLWKSKVGDRIFMTRKPVGKFTLKDTLAPGDKRICLLVAAGTGLAPFVSMVRSMKLRDANADMSRLVIFHGASYPADLGYRAELESYQKENGLKYLPSVSRPTDDWQGTRGRVEDFFLPDRLHELEKELKVDVGSLTSRTAATLICGLQGTIARCIERLACRGFVPFDRKIRKALELEDAVASSMWWEQYDTTPVVDIDNPEVVSALRRDLAAARRS
jgi:NAD(P)H-flavin reductase